MRARYGSTSWRDVTEPERIAACSSEMDFSTTSKAAGDCGGVPCAVSFDPRDPASVAVEMPASALAIANAAQSFLTTGLR